MLSRLSAALLPLVGLAAACSTLVPVRETPTAFIEAHSPGAVWITKTDNSVVVLAGPKVLGDTLGGFVGRDYVEIPLASVQSLSARRPAKGRTALLIGGISLAAGGVAYAILTKSANGASNPAPGFCQNGEPETSTYGC
jgi:hypothetical protein